MDAKISWENYFMSVVYLIAQRSDDPRTKIGAVIVSPTREIISTGYNGFPRGVILNNNRLTKEQKYFYMEHGERNAIFNAVKNGININDCSIYTNGTPCTDCGRAIIQSGIKTVYVDAEYEKLQWHQKWEEMANITKIMFIESGVKLIQLWLKDCIPPIKQYKDGKQYINYHEVL